MADQYEKLRELLINLNYPSVYMFKFIVKQNPEKVVDIKRCFSDSAEFSVKASKNGNYVAVSIKEMMLSSDAIIERYEEVAKIENVITL